LTIPVPIHQSFRLGSRHWTAQSSQVSPPTSDFKDPQSP